MHLALSLEVSLSLSPYDNDLPSLQTFYQLCVDTKFQAQPNLHGFRAIAIADFKQGRIQICYIFKIFK